MKTFARLEGSQVREVIERPDDFEIIKAYHSDLISAELGGTAQIGDGFIVVPAGATVKEGYLYDQADRMFSSPPPPLPPEKPLDVLSELVDVLITKTSLVMADFSADARAEITERKAQRR